MHRRFLTILPILILSVILSSDPAHAQWGNLQQILFRNAEFGLDRDFISSPQGGLLFDFNQFRQRVEYNRLGDGYTYEFFRFFGSDTFNNPNTLDLGPLKVQLGADPDILRNGQPLGVHNRVGYTTRFIPEIFFESETGQRRFDNFSGISSFAPSPVRYTVTLDTGVQNTEWNGNVFLQSEGKINAMGFYDFTLDFKNVGDFTSEGFIVEDEQITDFETGPINVSGNIMMDAIAGAFQSNGSPFAAVPARITSGASDRGKTVEDLLAQMKAGEPITQSEAQFLVQQMFVTAFISDPIGFVTNGPPRSVPGFEDLAVDVSEDQSIDPSDPDNLAQIPEPGTLLLLASAAILAAVRRWKLRP